MPISSNDMIALGHTCRRAVRYLSGKPHPHVRDIVGFPVKTPAVRHALVQDDICPECGGELDTGSECNDCGLDFLLMKRQG